MRNNDELWSKYVNRMRNHHAWKTKNISAWDLSISGASELNGFLRTSPDIYYFSYSFSATKKNKSTGFHIPNENIFLLIRSRAKLLGSKIVFQSNGDQTDSTWWENDGIVNLRSMKGPTTGLNGTDKITHYVETNPIIKGQWNTFDKIKLDHYQSIGHMVSDEQRKTVDSLYLNHAKRLLSLPSF